MIQKGKGLADLFKNITRPLAPVLNPVFKEVETITRPLKPVLNPILKEAKGIGTAVGVNLADGLLQDLITGKSSQASAKARGQQAGLNAKNMATACVLQALGRNGNGSFTGDPLIALDSDFEENITKPKQSSMKRKRTQSASQPPAKRKQTKKKTQKGGQLKKRKKRTQTGGFGGVFSALYGGMEKKARKRVLKHIDRKKRKKRAGKKRRKQKGRGKKRKPRKQTGRGKTGKGRKGKKRKSKKQKGGRGVRRVLNDIFNPRATITP